MPCMACACDVRARVFGRPRCGGPAALEEVLDLTRVRTSLCAGAKVDKKMTCPRVSKMKPNGSSPDEEVADVSEAGDAGGNHNKYSHFCQHVKVRASSMLACENSECSRRFCEHCLLTHLGEDVDPMSSQAWTMVDGKPRWSCPICRSKCCCSVTECTATHRHCKAYRYRRRRAELALKRMAAMTDKRASSKKAGGPKRPAAGTRPVIGLDDLTKDDVDVQHAETPPPSTSVWPEAHRTPKAIRAFIEAHDAARGAQHEYSRLEEERMQNQLLQGMWSQPEAGEEETAQHVPMLLHAHDEDTDGSEHAPRRGTAVSREDAATEEHDDIMSGVLGHMAEVADMGNLSSDVADWGWPAQTMTDMAPLDALFDEAEMRAHQSPGAKEVDEVEWLRRTYETVYNPAARQRALDQLLSSCTPQKQQQQRKRVPMTATKTTIMYDFV